MRQVVKIVRKSDLMKEKVQTLELETDYLLTSLFHAMQENDENEKVKYKTRLIEIQDELKSIKES